MFNKDHISCELVNLHRLLGKRWTHALLYNIDKEPRSYSELDNMSRREINPTLLSSRLKALVKFRLIKRETSNHKVYYSITKEGEKFKEILNQIKDLSREMDYDIPIECKDDNCSGCKIFKKEMQLYFENRKNLNLFSK